MLPMACRLLDFQLWVVYAFGYVRWAVMDLVRHNCRVPLLSQSSTRSPFAQQSKRELLEGTQSLMTYQHANYRTEGLSTEREDGDYAMNDILRLLC